MAFKVTTQAPDVGSAVPKHQDRLLPERVYFQRKNMHSILSLCKTRLITADVVRSINRYFNLSVNWVTHTCGQGLVQSQISL